MMYNSKLVASVKCGGKIMREQGDVVFLPFSSEYSLLLKNLNTKRALVTIEIDGEDVVPGGLILNSNQTIDLERFVLDGNLDKGPRFKFIEKTEKISDHRGDKVDDGIIRISYQYEAPALFGGTIYRSMDYWGGPYYGNMTIGSSAAEQTFSSKSVDGAVYNVSSSNQQINTVSLGNAEVGDNDAGITVKGSDSDQKFTNSYMGSLENEKHVIVLNLKGQVGAEPVVAPVTVARKIECNVCGKKNKSSNKFCSECGNNLTYQY